MIVFGEQPVAGELTPPIRGRIAVAGDITTFRKIKLDQGKIDMTYVPPEIIALLSDPFAAGHIKYERDGWRAGIGFRRLMAAAWRHFAKVLKRQQFDRETGCREKVQAAWNLLVSAMEDIYDELGVDLKDEADFDEFCTRINHPIWREEFRQKWEAEKEKKAT